MTLLRSNSKLVDRIEADLAELRADLGARKPTELYDPVGYVLESRGKRLRPLLVHLVSRSLGASYETASPVAQGVEVFHAFTLVHDDVMDNAATRRGRQTVHTKWDLSTAILAGDLLLGLSYELVSRVPHELLPRVMSTFGVMVARLCEGQTADMTFEKRGDVALDEYLRMIDRKTGALLECCFCLGGILGGGSDEVVAALGEAGIELGRAFQIQDDLLDLVATDPKWGKKIGGDLIEGKKAYLLLAALD
ncbi:MAG: polyprenyl synthetase family protein, partial [Rhodothermales bacterium]|nr:polyprenyl synthetase family protein [Rhodothermales bacterium]